MSGENFVLIIIVVGFLIYLIYEIYKESKNELYNETENEEVVDDFFEKLDTYVENTGYEVGRWDKIMRNQLKAISDIKNKYKTNREIKVLVGDYIEYSISNTVSVLESMGIKTAMAKSGLEVIKRIKDGEQYDLIISNNIYDRGRCDGPDTLKKLREIDNFNTPVIVLTISENARSQFVDGYGFNEYMTKLLTQDKVLETFPKVIKDLKFTKIRTKKESNNS